MEQDANRSLQQFQTLGKDNFDAAMASVAALARGIQSAAVEVADFSRKSIERNAETMERVLTAKSFDRAFEIQQDYARAAYEDYMAEVNRLGQIYLAAAKDAYKPFETRAEATLAETKAKVAEVAARVAK